MPQREIALYQNLRKNFDKAQFHVGRKRDNHE